MKGVKEALHCMGQMADKCLTSLGVIQKDYNEFVSLVRRMREAQKREWEIKSKQTCGKELDEHTKVVTILESEVDNRIKELGV